MIEETSKAVALRREARRDTTRSGGQKVCPLGAILDASISLHATVWISQHPADLRRVSKIIDPLSIRCRKRVSRDHYGRGIRRAVRVVDRDPLAEPVVATPTHGTIRDTRSTCVQSKRR
jgi:hypothetical protein